MRGGVVFLKGGPGVGKSNLVKALDQARHTHHDLRVSAMTNKVAHPTGGTTAHAVFILGRSKAGRLPSPLSDSDLRKLCTNLD